MLIDHATPADKHQGIIGGGVVGLAVAASVEQAGAVQSRSISFLHFSKTVEQISEALDLIKVPLNFVLGSQSLASTMSQSVSILWPTQEGGELVGDGDSAMHACELVSKTPRNLVQRTVLPLARAK